MMKIKRLYRIGIDARMFRSATGGIGRYSRELIGHIAKIDKENEYLVFITPEDLAEWDVNQPNFRPVVVNAKHYSFGEQIRFLWILIKNRCDLVHFLNFNHPLLYWGKFVVTLHDLTLVHYPNGRSQESKIRRFIFLKLFKHALTASKRVIAISEFSADDAVKTMGVSHAKTEIVYEGGPNRVEPEFGSKHQLQKAMGFKEPYFLFVSQWRPHKGIKTLIEAYQIFRDKTGLPHKLVLAGNPEVMREEVARWLVEHPYGSDIVSPGFVPEELLPALYAYSTAFVMPSEYEGFGLPLLEAMACSAPVISANNSSLPEVAGLAAEYFETGNVEDLAEKMIMLANNPDVAQSMREKGYKQLERFSWDAMAEKTLAVYKMVLEKGH